MDQQKVNEAVEKHKKWLRDEKGGERLSCEWREDFSIANLHGANLYGADLRGANLHGANLYGASLYEASLYEADLSRADLRGANLHGANLYGASLYEADLRGADLREADLSRASLYEADLRGADLHGANLYEADLRGADNIPELVYGLTLIATPEIKTGWKKLSGDLICKIEIPADAKRSNATGRKCRCEYAKVVEIWDGDKAVTRGYTDNGPRTDYIVGKMVYPDKFDDDRWNECSNGIHFFLTRVEAENY